MSNYFDHIDMVYRSDDLGFAKLSEKQKRKITAVMNMCDSFLMLGNGSVEAYVKLNDLKGYLFHRVAGKGNGGTYEGKFHWTTFLASELKNLVYGETKRYCVTKCHFTDEDFNGPEELRAFGQYVSTLVLEKSDTAPARALTLTDEDRLLSCLSSDALGCIDRLIIRLMYPFGCRSVPVWGIQMIDIQLANAEVGSFSALDDEARSELTAFVLVLSEDDRGDEDRIPVRSWSARTVVHSDARGEFEFQRMVDVLYEGRSESFAL